MGKRSRLWSLLTLFAATIFVGGCHYDSVYWWGEDISNHYKAVLRDADHIHWSIDRHFFNYDWDDPYIGY